MSNPVRLLAAAALIVVSPASGGAAMADESRVFVSHRAPADFALTADPDSPSWKGVAGVLADRDRQGQPVPGHRTEIRSRWTPGNLYLLYIAPYEELNLHPSPSTDTETNKLWEWDVAEAFIGSDFKNIKQYKEFQVSPQGEWVDLHIDRGAQPPLHDVSWNSSYEVKARIDRDKRVWYGEMRIPMKAIDPRPARAGNEMRINLYRIQGPEPRKHVNWQPVKNESFHTPEAFGTLRLQD
jgi:cellulose/xylan binding protein with CBM9 domain